MYLNVHQALLAILVYWLIQWLPQLQCFTYFAY